MASTRISTEFLYQRSLSAMLIQQSRLGKTQEQISLGKKLLSPSDDPTGSAQMLNYDRAIKTVAQYQDNANTAKNKLEAEERTLMALSDVMPRLRELAVQGGSDTYSAAQRQLMAVEVRQLQQHFLDLANTRDANGEYLFSGYQGNTQPFTEAGGIYTYHGDMGQRTIRVSEHKTIADGDNGFRLFMDVPTAAGPPRNAFETIEQMALALEAGTSAAGFIDDLSLVDERVLDTLASVGARLATLDEQIDVNEDMILSMEKNRSSIVDLDYAEAITRFQQQQTALEAAQKTFAELQGMSLFNFLR